MSKIMILDSTTDGHTVRICGRIQQVLIRSGHEVEVQHIASADPEVLRTFDKIVIGAAIRYGKHKQEVFDFVNENKALLASKASAFFSVNVVARKANRDTPETNPYLKKFLSKVSWCPDKTAVFAGKLDYPKYGFFDRTVIRLIMFMTKGPTDPTAVVEFTDWEKVEDFAKAIGEQRSETTGGREQARVASA